MPKVAIVPPRNDRRDVQILGSGRNLSPAPPLGLVRQPRPLDYLCRMKSTLRCALLVWLFAGALMRPAHGQYYFPDGMDVYTTSTDGNGKKVITVHDGKGKANYSFHSTDAKDKNGKPIFVKGHSALDPHFNQVAYGNYLAVVGGVSQLGIFDKPSFTPAPAPGLGTQLVAAPQAVAAVAPPTLIPISNAADTCVVSPDGKYVVVLGTTDNEPQNTATPVSLVDMSVQQEVSTLVVPGRAGSYVYATFCDDGETVLAVVGPAIHRLKITAGLLVDTGDALPLPAGASLSFLRVVAASGSKVGVALALFPARLVTFSIPGMQLLDTGPTATGSFDGLALSPDGTKVYSRSGYPVGEIDCFTLDPVTGLLGDTPFLTIPNVSPANIGIFGNGLAVTPDGAQLVATEGAATGTAEAPTPRITYFDAATGARKKFIKADTAPLLLALGPPGPPRGMSKAVFKKGEAPPEANGTVGKPPSDALFSTFGVPAIDDAEHLAFTARWTSATKAKGPGVFTETACVAVAGGSVPTLGAVTYKTFTDPLIENGHVAFLATASAVPLANSALVMSDAPTGALEVVAQSGVTPTGAGDAKFRSFKGVAIAGSSVAVFAQLTGGTGLSHISAANDLGLWMKDATHPLTPVLREGSMIGQRKITTLVSFMVGNGSPGQGRGWLRNDGTTPKVLALVILDRTAQAIVSSTYGGVPVVESESGPGGGGPPNIMGASFASYGVPAANAANQVAFAGAMTVNAGGVLRADAHGIFASNGAGAFTPIARVTKLSDPANAAGPTFSVLKDPVLGNDGALAFPATLKGGGLKGLAINSLWYQPAGGSLALFAQGGAAPPNLSNVAQFRAFTSLAISDRGPLFTATLLAGKGGVVAATAKGMWGVDSKGITRLLFRTGDEVDDLTVKDFTALLAVPGSLGTTHSFNAAGTVAWRASFVGGSTAIVKTVAP